jgi:hypothetical protein
MAGAQNREQVFQVTFDAARKRWVGTDDNGQLIGVSDDRNTTMRMVVGVANQLARDGTQVVVRVKEQETPNAAKAR